MNRFILLVATFSMIACSHSVDDKSAGEAAVHTYQKAKGGADNVQKSLDKQSEQIQENQ